MIVNNLPDMVRSSMATKNALSATDGTSFATTLEKKITSVSKKTPEPDPMDPQLQADPDTIASVLIAGSENGLDTALAEADLDKRDEKKVSDETSFIDPQIQQLQQLLAQTPPASPDGVTADVQVAQPAQAEAVETAAVAQTPASGPLTQPFMLDSRKDGAAQADLNPGNKDNLFVSMLDKKAEGEKPAELMKQEADAPAQPLMKEAETPHFHSAMIDSLKEVALPARAAVETARPTASGVLNQTLGTPEWQQSLGQQISMFTRNGIHNAELRLHPEELGALQINLRLNNDRAQLHFVTENYQVRAAIEAAMPHLRSSLAESGIQLGQSSIGADTSSSGGFYSRSEQDNQPRANEHVGELAPNIEDATEVQTRVIQHRHGINTFV